MFPWSFRLSGGSAAGLNRAGILLLCPVSLSPCLLVSLSPCLLVCLPSSVECQDLSKRRLRRLRGILGLDLDLCPLPDALHAADDHAISLGNTFLDHAQALDFLTQRYWPVNDLVFVI